MERRYFLQLDKERMTFMDEIGGCERILKTPMPRAYSIAIRRFIIIFLVLLPFGLIPKIDRDRFNQAAGSIDRSRMWLTPLVAMIAAFPLLALDRIGEELQNPFSTKHLNHLDLDGITATIERNLLALIDGPLVDQDITKHIDVIEIVTRDDGAG
jgi:putative membrane protein